MTAIMVQARGRHTSSLNQRVNPNTNWRFVALNSYFRIGKTQRMANINKSLFKNLQMLLYVLVDLTPN